MATVIKSKTAYGHYVTLEEYMEFLGGIMYQIAVDGRIYKQSKDRAYIEREFNNY